MDSERTKRSHWHDYHEKCIYLITVTVKDRKPLLGVVKGDVNKAWISLSQEGKAVWSEIESLPKRYPQVRVLQHQIMPDHVHLVLYVTERLPEGLPLGNIIASWKVACSKACAAPNSQPIRDLKAATHNGPTHPLYTATGGFPSNDVLGLSSEAAFRSPTTSTPSLFERGYNDSILTGRGQLQHIMAYVRDNPRRLLIKQQCRQYFVIHRSIAVAGMPFDAIGNLDLLRYPLLAVHCRRRWTEQETAAYTDYCRTASAGGSVLIGAFISKAEQAIAHQAHEEHRPLIHLVENGFSELYKPVGRAFYSCADGRLLQLAPWPYHNDSRAISRSQCMELNRMAEAIAECANRAPAT